MCNNLYYLLYLDRNGSKHGKRMKGVKGVRNYYGGIFIQKVNGKYYWIIENYDTDFGDIDEWTEITPELYGELNKLTKHG